MAMPEATLRPKRSLSSKGSARENHIKFRWYAIKVLPGRDTAVENSLTHKGYEIFLPRIRQYRSYSRRRFTVRQPLFRGYVFCKLGPPDQSANGLVVTTPGVAYILGYAVNNYIEDQEIESLKILVDSDRVLTPCAYLQEGQRVRIVQGSLAGAEGILLKHRDSATLVVSISLLQRCVSVVLDSDDVAGIPGSEIGAGMRLKPD